MRTLSVAAFLAFSACAPIQATTAISRASEELRTARLAGADDLAPYEFTKADLYLKMAKERQGFSDFEGAQFFAEQAEKFAVAAKRAAPENLRLRERLKRTSSEGGEKQ